MQNSKRKIQNLVLLFYLLPFAFCLYSCSIPSLEPPDCTAARDVAKRYYSLAIGGELASHPDALAQIKALVAPNFSAGPVRDDANPFTLSVIPPTSFRVGECFPLSDGKVKAEVLLLWRGENRNTERKHSVELVKLNDTWLIDRITVEPSQESGF